jgi:hypothetical protein
MAIYNRYSSGRLKFYMIGNSGGIDYGTETTEAATATADRKFVSVYVKTTATSGDARGIYARLNMAGTAAGAGYGDALRTLGYVTGTGYDGAYGTHSTLRIGTGATVTGSGAGLRATLEADAATRTLSGALAALQVDSYVGANNTMPTIHGFVRFSDVGDTVLNNLMVLPSTASNSTVFATHTTQAMSHSIRIIDSAGTPYFIMCASAATNRGGGS